MNQDNDKQEALSVDPQVSAHYGKFADEKTPADLDRAVLREATRAVQADNRIGSFGAWFRPVAFMTTIGLSLALILDLSDTSIFNPSADMPLEIAPPAPVKAPANIATEAVEMNRPQMSVSEVMRQKKSVSAQSMTVDAPDNSSDYAGVSKSQAAVFEHIATEAAPLIKNQPDLAAANIRPEPDPLQDQALVSDAISAEDTSAEQRVNKLETAAGAYPQTQPAADAQFTKSKPVVAIESFSPVAPKVCSDEQKSAVEEWWKCIETLRQSGLAEAADLELERLHEEFPEFEPPQ